jgi:thioredoxin 1
MLRTNESGFAVCGSGSEKKPGGFVGCLKSHKNQTHTTQRDATEKQQSATKLRNKMPVTYIDSADEFNALMETSKSKLVAIDFTATWCGPCRFIGPIFDTLSEEYTDVEFVKVDVDKAHEVKALCRIHAMPTFQFFKNGELVDHVVGANQNKLTATLDKLAHGTPDREAELESFIESCMVGNASDVQRRLEADPGLVNQAAPREWHDYHVMRRGWQPVADKNPGVKNATGAMYLRANSPAYGLHLAAGNGHTKVIKVLLGAKANLEAGDGDGDTALAWATWSGRRDTMNQLLSSGADPGFANSLSREQFEGVDGDGASLDYLKEKMLK